MGYLGDVIGRNRALSLSISLTGLSALASGLVWGEPTLVYTLIAVLRFTLGVGVGGCYPLSATKAAESADKEESDAQRLALASWAFFWQIPGVMAPYIVALILMQTSLSTNVQFRVLLTCGAIPTAIVLPTTLGKQVQTCCYSVGLVAISVSNVTTMWLCRSLTSTGRRRTCQTRPRFGRR